MITPTQAVSARIRKLLKERNMTIYRLAIESGMQQGTLANVMGAVTKSTGLTLIMQICSGLNMTLSEFFDDEIFNEDNVKF
jgi:transcriptional regulator with XRE-family HTH domain